MSIAKRLVLLIFAAVGSTLALGIFAEMQLAKVGDGGKYIYSNTLPSYDALYLSSIRLNEVRAIASEHILATQPDSMAAAERELNVARADMLGRLDHYGKSLLTNAEDEALWKAATKNVQAYLDVVDTTLRMSHGGQKQEAGDYLKSHAELHAQAAKSLDADIKFNTRVAEDFIVNYQKTYAWAVGFIVAVLLIAALLCSVLGTWIYRSVIGALKQMRETLTKIDHDRDFTLRARHGSDDEVGEMVDAFNHLIAGVQESLTNLRERANKVTAASSALATAAAQVSISSSQQSESASDMAATVEEMTVSISHVADQTAEANRLSENSGQLAQAGEGVITQTVEDIHKIAETVRVASEDIGRLDRNSEQISAVVAVIREVAEQTNLLALNAAIEAARAGEQGRGFAVVADEVRKLAERTAKSTEEISSSIASMQVSAQSAVKGMQAVAQHVESGVQQAGEANQAMQRIGQSAQQAVHMVGEISLAIREQSTASNSIAQQIERIAQTTEENSAAAESTAATAKALDQVATEMQGVVAQFRI
jgi:methyl-accepting chemotaxis protein